jgi:hypothetical protein
MIYASKLKHDSESELLAVLSSIATDNPFFGESVNDFEHAAKELWSDVEYMRRDCDRKGIAYKEPQALPHLSVEKWLPCLHGKYVDLPNGDTADIVADYLAMEVRVKSYAMDEAA